MNRVVVEHPIEEAEALLKRLGIGELTDAEAKLARAGMERLEQAVKVERGTSGGAQGSPLAEEAKALIDHDVLVRTRYGARYGRLREVFSSCALVVKGTDKLQTRRRIPMAQVISVEPVEELAEAV